jgi:hypothetical protein
MTELDFYKKNKYVVLKKIINEETCNLLYYYMKLETRRLMFLEKQNIEIQKIYGLDKTQSNYALYGQFDDIQCPDTFSRYGCLVFDTLNLLLTPKMEQYTGLDLIPTYSYHRLYKNGDVLKKHIDRKSCEISTTLCVGYDISNLEDKNYNWPMYVSYEGKSTALHLEPGDMIIYNGCEIEHWRENFLGVNHGQAFLHYNKKDANNTNLYDNRPELGLLSTFKNNS